MAQISGAIFDFDGTLVDSMQMWYGVIDTLLADIGLEPTQELRTKLEAMSIHDAAVFIHEEMGFGESVQALEQRVDELVLSAYKNTIKPIPGALEFVKSLNAAHIPCIIATSTSSHLVKPVLGKFGLEGLVQDVLCASEVRGGRDKDFPDVYLEALGRLGTRQDETWVFEDAQFAIRSARSAGFHVAAIFNNHDGRDASYIQSWADIFSHYYENISLSAIDAFDDTLRKVLPEC